MSGGYYGGAGDEDGATTAGGGGSTNVLTYNHYDQRRRDGGFYGGNGVFYGDDGYSRLPREERAHAAPKAGPYDNPYVIYLPEPSQPDRREARHEPIR